MRTDIIIIDDSEMHLESVTKLFDHEGYKSIAVSDPEVALPEIKRILPKLILLDIMMPGVDGFSLLKKIKTDKETQAIPVVVLTGKVFPPDQRKALALGAEKYLTKPISSTNLLEEIRFFLKVSDDNH